MKKFITAASLAIAVGGLTNIAVAEDCQPDETTETEETWSPTGIITLSTLPNAPLSIFAVGSALTCDLTASLTLDGSDASVTAIQLSGNGSICSTANFTNLPYNLEGNPDGTVTLQNVEFYSGVCSGDLTGDFDQATG